MKRSILLTLIISILSALCVAGIIATLVATRETEEDNEGATIETSVEAQQIGKFQLTCEGNSFHANCP